MKSMIKTLTSALVISSCTALAQDGNIAYVGPIGPQDLSIRKVLSDVESGILNPEVFTADWKLADGKSFQWKTGAYQIDPSLGNHQRIIFPEVRSLKPGDAMVFHMKVKNDQQNHFRFIGDMRGIKHIYVDGKALPGDHIKLPPGEYDLLLVYIHKSSHKEGIPFTMASALSGKVLENLIFEIPEISGEIQLPAYENGTVEFAVTDSKSREPKPCRLYVYNEKDEPQYDDTCPDCFETFTCTGSAKLILPEGRYTYTIESGKEFVNAEGVFEIANGKTIKIEAALVRFSNLNADGWYAADLHNHTTVEGTPLLMESENIHIAYVPWWWINPPMGRTSEKTLLDVEPLLKLPNNRFIDTRVGEDERWDATLMFFGMPENIKIPNASWSSPPSVHFAKEFGKIDGVWVHLDHMFWWQTPAILASGELDSIEVLNNNFVHGGMNNTEAWGKKRDMEKYGGPWGNAVYQQDIYFKILNTGLRIPPAAGSAACVGGGPFGYNRVYAHVEGDLTYKKWWQALREGKVFITNGPLLRAKANGQLPGHVFKAGGKLSIATEFELAARENITAIQLIKNGDVVASISSKEWGNGRKLPHIEFDQSGWFLVRVLTDNPGTYRTALTGPYYVEIGKNKSHTNADDIKFFLDWAKEAAEQNIAPTAEERALFDKYSEETITFWENLYRDAL